LLRKLRRPPSKKESARLEPPSEKECANPKPPSKKECANPKPPSKKECANPKPPLTKESASVGQPLLTEMPKISNLKPSQTELPTMKGFLFKLSKSVEANSAAITKFFVLPNMLEQQADSIQAVSKAIHSLQYEEAQEDNDNGQQL